MFFVKEKVVEIFDEGVFCSDFTSIQNLLYHERYFNERKKYKIHTRYIFIEGEKYPLSPLADYRYLPKHYKSFAATAIHGNEVSFWLLTKPEVIILVKNKEFAETYKNNFEALWKLAKK